MPDFQGQKTTSELELVEKLDWAWRCNHRRLFALYARMLRQLGYVVWTHEGGYGVFWPHNF